MKKLFILILAITFTACDAPVNQEGAGFFIYDEDEKFVVASDEVNDVWVKYIDAHNNRDMDAIRGFNSDSILVIGPDGARINGTDEHINFLDTWFSMADPKWDIYWSMPYKGVTGGEEWVIAGHSVTLKDGEAEVKKNQMIDAKIQDGKVQLFYVYQMDVPDVTPAIDTE
tara:strand:- start:600 stop:1109 length:510 start_codon:yes stop_codon:yes gene_type:complete